MHSIIELDSIFRSDRPRMVEMNRSDIPRLFLRLIEEVNEAREEVRGVSQGKEGAKQRLADEYADIALFALEGIRSCGLDPDTVVREKIGRNTAKYPASYFQNGLSPESAIAKAREEWPTLQIETR